jgi:SAM-dependent methyltransferase
VTREQRLVFGEIAEQYEAARPDYPGELFDAVLEYGALSAGASALEIGAGTGKATMAFLDRGVHVHALEPSAPMAEQLRRKGVDAEVATFESFTPDRPFDLVYAAQSWHWVGGDDRYERVAAALGPGGVIALFWNQPRDWEGALAEANDAAYREHAPHLVGGAHKWTLDLVLDEIAASGAFTPAEKRVFTGTQTYTRAEYVALLGTHSDHRMLADDVRARLHAAVGAAIDAHGGTVDVVYDTKLYLARRN